MLERQADFQAHVAAIVSVSWESFLAELRRLWPERVDTSFSEATLSALARTSWDDALGFAGAKMIRRMIGFAHVSDIETLDETERIVAGLLTPTAGEVLLDCAQRAAHVRA